MRRGDQTVRYVRTETDAGAEYRDSATKALLATLPWGTLALEPTAAMRSAPDATSRQVWADAAKLAALAGKRMLLPSGRTITLGT